MHIMIIITSNCFLHLITITMISYYFIFIFNILQFPQIYIAANTSSSSSLFILSFLSLVEAPPTEYKFTLFLDSRHLRRVKNYIWKGSNDMPSGRRITNMAATCCEWSWSVTNRHESNIKSSYLVVYLEYFLTSVWS